ncbi:uncharacterized protein IUM83_08049 [Phytophthora cinnamomi]|uniref:uncharacterized protein n=1 Tax=Phytophthora cinnamomi TaxID=4785 RepID=UPI00355A1D3C|nr:hypothetical protein IUM83_08049 [Phytophthora cinnamomi]
MDPSLTPPQWSIDLWHHIQLRDEWILRDFRDQLLQSEHRMFQRLQQSEELIQQQQEQIELGAEQSRSLRRQLSQLQEEQQRTGAILHNTRAAVHNARVFRDGAVHGGVRQLHRFVKTTPGLGDLLPGMSPPCRDIPWLPVGEVVPRRFFPTNYASLRRWGHRRINELSILLNDDFGIDSADVLEERRGKLQHYLAGGMG